MLRTDVFASPWTRYSIIFLPLSIRADERYPFGGSDDYTRRWVIAVPKENDGEGVPYQEL